jgi:hypothetical protein
MMHGGLSVGEPSLLEITDNQNSMEAADKAVTSHTIVNFE